MVKSILCITTSLLLASTLTFAQTTTIRGTTKGSSTADPVTSTSIDANKTGLDVNIVGSTLGAAGDGAILDGVSAAIKATVKDFTNSNPLTVHSVDANGDYAAPGGDGIIRDGTGDTTQANVSSGRVHVDGSGVTQPISAASLPLPTGAATSANQDGIIRDGTGDTTQANVAAGRLSVDITGVAGTAAVTAAAGVQKVGVVGNANAAFDAANAAAPPANRLAVGGLTSGATGGLMVSPTYCDSFANVNIVTATTTLIVTGVSGRHVRICGISLVTAGANNVALISGTGATCGTGTTGMTGGTTAATGYNFAANGGVAHGTGIGEINRTNATGDSVCIITSAAVQLSGRLSYAIY